MQSPSAIEVSNMDNFRALPPGAPITFVERAHLSDLDYDGGEVDPLEGSPLSVGVVFAYILWLEVRVAHPEVKR